ncbi:ankyrin [Coprinopsis marcescibilis]|uniref:Ankyrin n=1 Tax=Coprinopsis marcescibilis TaxID=230819 RepID=A0A5C3KDP7_COPMA|nr:ankyrin [Coprinopsis marcescibilis]
MGNKFSKPARVGYKGGKRAKLSSGGEGSNLAALEVLKGAQGVHISNFHVTVAGGDVVNNTYHSAPGSAAITDADNALLATVLESLGLLNFRSIFDENVAKRTPETGREVIDSDWFKEWLMDLLGGIVWGTGMPGAGKTVLACIVIEHLQKLVEESESKDVCLLFAFCRYTERLMVIDILLAILRQLLERHPQVLPYVKPMYERHKRENTRPSEAEVVDLLRQIATSGLFKQTLYILDGLDEAASDIQVDLIEILSSLPVHFFITSRPLDTLKDLVPNARFFTIIASDPDIALLIDQKIHRIPALRKLLINDATLKAEVVSMISSKSSGILANTSDINAKDAEGRTALVHAVSRGSVEVLEMLVAVEGIDHNCVDANGQTPLMTAATCGPVGTVELLLELEGININSTDKQGRTALAHAISNRWADTFDTLLPTADAISADYATSEGLTYLSLAAQSGNAARIRSVLQLAQFDVNARDIYSHTALAYAVKSRSSDSVEVLLEIEGVNIHCVDEQGTTLLMSAAGRGEVEMVSRFLGLGLGANINVKDENGQTALAHAVLYGSTDVVMVLLGIEGIDYNCVDSSSRTPLMMAAEGGNIGIVDVLLELEGIRIDSRDDEGLTAMAYAVSSRQGSKIFESLLNVDSTHHSQKCPNTTMTQIPDSKLLSDSAKFVQHLLLYLLLYIFMNIKNNKNPTSNGPNRAPEHRKKYPPPNQPDLKQVLEALGIKIRDFAHDPSVPKAKGWRPQQRQPTPPGHAKHKTLKRKATGLFDQTPHGSGNMLTRQDTEPVLLAKEDTVTLLSREATLVPVLSRKGAFTFVLPAQGNKALHDQTNTTRRPAKRVKREEVSDSDSVGIVLDI